MLSVFSMKNEINFQLYPEMSTTPILITETQQVKFGDYQFNSSMSIAKVFSASVQFFSEIIGKMFSSVIFCNSFF